MICAFCCKIYQNFHEHWLRLKKKIRDQLCIGDKLKPIVPFNLFRHFSAAVVWYVWWPNCCLSNQHCCFETTLRFRAIFFYPSQNQSLLSWMMSNDLSIDFAALFSLMIFQNLILKRGKNARLLCTLRSELKASF